MIYEMIHPHSAAPLFGDWEETLIWSCLQGVMGKVYADDFVHPTAAMAVLGDFAFFAGEPNGELIAQLPQRCTRTSMILVPQNSHWERAIAGFFGNRTTPTVRYATKKEPNIFDVETLERAVAALPQNYQLSMIDKALYQRCQAEVWSKDLVGQFPSYQHYCELGLGAVICKDGVVVSGASSYSRYREGIEIQIDTKQEFRRQGLAYVCGAKLILECQSRNLYPSWDAHTPASVALAEKLGYHYSHTYRVLEVSLG